MTGDDERRRQLYRDKKALARFRNEAMFAERVSQRGMLWRTDPFSVVDDTRRVPFSWKAVAELIAAGENPAPEDIAEVLRGSEERIPKELREYIAGLLDGTVKRKRGPRNNTLRAITDAYIRDHCVRRVQRLAERLKRRGVPHAYTEAKEHVAEKTGIPVDTLDAWVYPRRRCT
jgi:hypothetical protein